MEREESGEAQKCNGGQKGKGDGGMLRLREEELALAGHRKFECSLAGASPQHLTALGVQVVIHSTTRKLLKHGRARELELHCQLGAPASPQQTRRVGLSWTTTRQLR